MAFFDLKSKLFRLSALGCVSVPVATFYWNTPLLPSAMIGGRIDAMRSMHIASLERVGRISPLCGCDADLPKESWSGISFIAPEISASFRPASSKIYVAIISATYPASISSQTDVLLYADIRDELIEDIKLDKDEYPLRTIYILSEKPIIIRGNQTAPQYTYIPSKGSGTEINFGDKNYKLLIDSSTENFVSGDIDDYASTVDVIGPYVSVSLDKEHSIVTAHFPKSLGAKGVNYLKPTGSLRIKTPFALRFSFGIVDPSIQSIKEIRESKPAVEFMLGKGRFNLEAIGTLDEKWYEEAKDILSRERVVFRDQFYDNMEVGDHSGVGYAANGPGAMFFRMPFIAPRLGIDLYGSVENLEMRNAVGNLVVGSQSVSMPAPSDLTFSGISPVKKGEEYASKPLTFDRKSGGALEFQANSRIKMNNEDILISRWTIGSLVGILATIVGLISTGFSVFRGPQDIEVDHKLRRKVSFTKRK